MRDKYTGFLMFGIVPERMGIHEEDVLFWWGARAIYYRRHFPPVMSITPLREDSGVSRKLQIDLEIPHDRQQCPHAPEGLRDRRHDEEFRSEHKDFFDFETWIFSSGLPTLKAELQEQDVTMGSWNRVRFEEGPYILEATPNGSCGYMYIGVVRKKEAADVSTG